MKITTGSAAILGASVLVVGSAFYFSPSMQHVDNASAGSAPLNYSSRMLVLKNIPLVPGAEKLSSSEAEDTQTLIEIFSKFANHNATPSSNGGPATLHRGTHAKGQCFEGTFSVLDDRDLQQTNDASQTRRLKQGFLSLTHTYPVTMRFANADGTGRIQSDATADVRGFSFSIHGLPNRDFNGDNRQDIMMNSTAAFATGGIHEFLELVKAANLSTYKDPSYPINPLYIPDVLRDSKLVQKGDSEGGGIESYATTQYWANLPYTHGINPSTGQVQDLVKYKATPCDGRPTQRLPNANAADPDYLQNDIQSRVLSGQVCFNFQVQFYDLAALQATAQNSAQKTWTAVDWVENGGLLWDETAMPFHTVAQIKAQGHAISCDDQYINSRLHSSPANQPVGSIARVRTFIEETSRARRMGEIK